MKNKIEKINVLNNKIKTSNLDVDSIEFLSKIAGELSKFQDKVAKEAYIPPSQNGFSSLRNTMQHLEQSRSALQIRIQKRQHVCSAIKTNESIINSTMGHFTAFLKEFTTALPNLSKYKEILFQNLNTNKEFNEFFEQYITSESIDPKGDVMSALFHVFKESIEQTNEDKQYFLSKLADMNEIAEAMSDYLKELNEAFVDTEAEVGSEGGGKGNENRNKGMIGYANIKITKATASLQNALKDFGKWVKDKQDREREEREEREERKKRGAFQSMFENFDQKTNQLFQLLSTVIKSMKEMQSGVIRNLL